MECESRSNPPFRWLKPKHNPLSRNTLPHQFLRDAVIGVVRLQPDQTVLHLEQRHGSQHLPLAFPAGGDHLIPSVFVVKDGFEADVTEDLNAGDFVQDVLNDLLFVGQVGLIHCRITSSNGL